MADPHFQIKVEHEKPGYGKFALEPLEQGYGQTLGNSLRRVLLTSLPGAAITAVKIEGVKHQFSTIAGLKEDVVELILNIKKIRLHVDGDQQVTMKLSKTGPGEVTAGDIEEAAGVTIANSDLVLGTLADKKSHLEMELTVSKGFGYASVEDTREEALAVIPIDALYSPITRVNYRVEATRVGRMTNLDRLIMEIWTDGTISPYDALIASANILISYFTQIVHPTVEQKQEAVVEDAVVSEEVLKTRIEELDIPTRIVNALSKGGIDTIGQLLDTPREDLMKVKNLGAKSLAIVEEKLKEKNVTLPA